MTVVVAIESLEIPAQPRPAIRRQHRPVVGEAPVHGELDGVVLVDGIVEMDVGILRRDRKQIRVHGCLARRVRQDVLDGAACRRRQSRLLVSGDRTVGDVFEHPADIAVNVANAERRERDELALESDHKLVEIRELRARIDGVGELTGSNIVVRHRVAGRRSGHHAVGNRLRQVGVEVVAAADAVVGRQRAGSEVVRDPRVESAEISV